MVSIYQSFSIQRVWTKGPLTLNTDDFPWHGQLFLIRIKTTHLTAFWSRLNGSASVSFLIVHTLGINVNTDQKRFRYSGVDKAYIALSIPFWNIECTHLNDVDHSSNGSEPPRLKIFVFRAFCRKSVTGFYSCIPILDWGNKQTKWISLNEIWSVGPIIWQNIALILY